MSSNSDQDSSSALFAAIRHLLRPLIKILLNHGVPFAKFAEIARGVYVEVADADFALPGRKQTDSRVSVLTGLTRKEVARLRGMEKPEDIESAQSYNRAARVVSAWKREHPLEGTASGVSPLPLEGEVSLASLIRRHSGDMPVRAVVDELMRVGTIRLMANGEVELLHRSYLPPPGERRKLVYLGDDVADLIGTIGHNLEAKQEDTYFQRKVFYDNVPVERLPAARDSARKHGEIIIDNLVNELAVHDRDVHPDVEGSGRMRIVVGIYYHEAMFTGSGEGEAAPTPTPDGKKRLSKPPPTKKAQS